MMVSVGSQRQLGLVTPTPGPSSRRDLPNVPELAGPSGRQLCMIAAKVLAVSTTQADKEPKQFYARIPLKTYQRLRHLAGHEEARFTADGIVPISFRIGAETREKLRRISLEWSLQGEVVSMQNVIVQLIDTADAHEVENATTMKDVVCQLIDTAYAR